jgi:hypothetical protein
MPCGIEQVSGKTLEQPRFAWINAEVMELHLRLRPRQRGRPLEGGDVPMLVGKVEHGSAGRGDHRPEGDTHDGAGCDAHAAAQGEDRIEHDADRIRERPPVDHGDRRANAAATADETGSVGLHLRLAHAVAVDGGEVRGPDLGLVWRPPPPRRQEDARVDEILGLDEQFGKGRMRDIRRLRRQHQFGIRGDVELSRPVPGVQNRHTSDLRCVFGRDENLQGRRQRAIATREFGAVLLEGDLVGVRLGTARLKAGRPHVVAADISEVDVTAPVVAGDVFPPPRHR